MNLKRGLALLMTVCMLIGMLPTAGASAEEYPAITPDVEQTVTISEEGEVAYFTYTPAYTERYTFYSIDSNNRDTYGYLYDSNMNELASNDDSAGNWQFSITYTLEAGETYILGARFLNDNVTGTFSVVLEINHNEDIYIYDYGFCGDNLEWTLDEAGTLTISGTGKMYNWYLGSYGPWYGYNEMIKTVIIEDGVSSIGNCAFYGCGKLTSITLPDSLTRIGEWAFASCGSLISIHLPNGITSIGYSTFEGCSGLLSVDLPNSLTKISYSAFAGCSSLASIDLPDSITSIGGSAFIDCSSLMHIEFPANLNYIDQTAFANCSSLTDIIFTGNAPSISSAAFRNVDATAYYHSENTNWTNSKRQNYGGNLRWVALSQDCLDGNHTFAYVSDRNATCQNDGTKTAKCAYCYVTDTIADPGSKTDHRFVYQYNEASNTSTGSCIFQCGTICTIEGWPAISIDVEQPVNIAGRGEIAYYTFTPTYTESYTFYSIGNEDTYGYLYDSDMNELVLNDQGGDKNNFSITYTLEAGKTYIWGARYYSAKKTGTFSVILKANHIISYSEIIREATCTKEGLMSSVCDSCGETFTQVIPMKSHTWNHISWEEMYSCATCGLTLSEITKDEQTWVTFYSTGETVYFAYTPWATESYTFRSTDWGDRICGYFMDSAMNVLAKDNVGGNGDNFSITHTLEEGKTYILCVEYMGSYGPDSFGLIFEANHRWNKGVITQEATCTEDGVMTYTCNACWDEYTEVIPKGHLWREDAMICTRCEEVFCKEGMCDNNLTWILDETGTLTISGEGAIGDYFDDNQPWQAFREHITSLVIKPGVTEIGDSAFSHCSNLTSVDLPDSVTSIGGYAFFNCSSLTSIDIRESIRTIGYSAFENCRRLKTIHFRGDAPNLDDDVFYNVTATAYYSGSNSTWTEGRLWGYGGDLVWVAMPDDCLAGNHTVTNYFADGNATCMKNGTKTGYCDACDMAVTMLDIGSKTDHKFSNYVYDADSRTSSAVCSFGCGNTSIVEGWPPITAGVAQQANISEEGDVAYFVYTPAYTESYTFYSYGGAYTWTDTYGYLYDGNMNQLDADDDTGDGNNFSITYTLEAGKTYILGAKFLDDYETGTFSVMLKANHSSNGNGRVTKESTCTEEGSMICNCDICGVTFAKVIPMKGHSWNYRDWDKSYVCDACELTIPIIETDIETQVTIAEYGDMAYFAYTPDRTESYTFYSVGVEEDYTDAYGYLYDSDMNALAWEEASGDFSITTTLEKGKTYILGTKYRYDDEKGTYSVALKVTHNWGYGALICTCCGEALYAEGTCGENLTWTLDHTGTLTVSGNGEMYDYDYDGAPWWDFYRDAIKNVVIENGVTSIGDRAFYNCYDLSGVTIPNSVNRIGSSAFSSCYEIKRVKIPDSVTELGDYAFYSCNDVTDLTIGNGVTSIPSYAFAYCDELQSVVIPESAESIDYWAFGDCNNLSSVYFKGNAPAFNEEAFTNVSAACYYPSNNETWTEDMKQNYGGNLTWLVMPDGCLSGDHVFTEYISGNNATCLADGTKTAHCDNCGIMDVVIDAGSKLDHLFNCYSYDAEINTSTAFCGRGCGTVDEVNGYPVIIPGVEYSATIPKAGEMTYFRYTPAYTEEYLFYSYSFVSRQFTKCAYLYDSNMNLLASDDGSDGDNEIAITYTLEAGESYILGCSSKSLYDFTIGLEIKHSWSEDVHKEASCTEDGRLRYICDICGIEREEVIPKDHLWREDALICTRCGEVFHAEGTWGDNLTWVLDEKGTLTFCGTGDMYSYDPNQRPWDEYKNYIKTVNIAEGITSIGYYTFYECANLERVTIPNSVTDIGDVVFAYCESLADVTLPNGITTIPIATFAYCSNLTEITIPDTVTEIGWCAFSETGCESIFIPASVTDIHRTAFGACWSRSGDIGCGISEKLKTITVDPQNPAYASDAQGALYSKDMTKLIRCPSGFEGTFVIPDSVQKIGEDAFNSCEKLTEIRMSNRVTEIGDRAFSGSVNLQNIKLSENLTEIPHSAFEDCIALTEITIPEKVTSIRFDAFFPCTSLRKVVFEGNAPEIEDGAFYGVTASCFYSVDSENWTEAAKGNYGGMLTWLPSGKCGENLNWTLDEEGTLTISGTGEMYNWESSYEQPWHVYQSQIDAVVVQNGVTSIGNYAFSDCEAVTEIHLPESVKSIGNCAFINCSFESIVIPDKVTRIESDTFVYCDALTSITFGSSLEVIPPRAFYYCHNLSNICFTSDMPQIGDTAFSDVIAKVYYPCDKTGYEPYKLLNYGGMLTWEKVHGEYTATMKAPTCTEDGCTIYTCPACDDTYEMDRVEALDHDYTYTVSSEPDLINTGVVIGSCSRCTHKEEVFLPQLNADDYTYEIVFEPTYTQTGIGTYTWKETAYGTFSFAVTLDKLEATLEELTVVTNPTKTVYHLGEPLDTTGLVLRATYSDGSIRTVTSGYRASSLDSATPGEKTITVNYEGRSTTFQVTVQPMAEADPQIMVSDTKGVLGHKVNVTISLKNNPGITSMMLQIGYDPGVMELVSVTDAGKLGNVGHSDNYGRNPYVLSWENDLVREDFVVDGEIVTLTFLVAEDAPVGETAVTISYTCGNYDIFNAAGEDVWFATVNGSVNVIDVLLGDVNSDGKVNTQDRMILSRYLAKWSDYPESIINMVAADVNCDGRVNTQDRTILARHLAKWTGYETLGG